LRKNICFWAPDWMNFRLVNSPSCEANIQGEFGQAVFAAEAEFISGQVAIRPPPQIYGLLNGIAVTNPR
jgi:hypothetical protein